MITGNFRWNKGCKIVSNGKETIVSNESNWLKISTECFDIIGEAIRNNCSMKEVLEAFEDLEDQNYFKVLVQKLQSFGALVASDYEEKNDINVYFVLTNRCNLKCAHCCVCANEDEKDIDILSIEDILLTIDKLIELNPFSITITGGEPLIRKDIFEILRYLSDNYKGKIFLMTNGLLLNKQNVLDVIPYVDHIDISIDGVDEETCSAVRGKGVFTKVLDVVDLLHKNNYFKISLSMVFGSNNKHLIETFEELNRKHNTTAIVREFAPLGRGKINSELFVSKDKKVISPVLNESLEELRKNVYVGQCGAIENGFTIDYTGYIYPCSLLMKEKYILGDVRKIDDLKEWFENHAFFEAGYRNFQNLIPMISQKCKDCNINIFCWDCLELMDRLSESPEKWEKRCKAQKKYLEPIVWS